MQNAIRKNYICKNTYEEKDNTLVSYITTKSPDRYKDTVEPSGAKLENFKNNPVVLLNHDHYSLPVGRNMWIKIEEKGIIAKTEFAPTPAGKDVALLYKEGFLNAFSIGFLPLEYQPNDEGGLNYTQWELLEYSGVTVPANPSALALAIKSIQSPMIKEQLNEYSLQFNLLQRVDQLATELKSALTLKEQLESYLEELKEFGDVVRDMTEIESQVLSIDERMKSIESTMIKKEVKPIDAKEEIKKLIAKSLQKKI